MENCLFLFARGWGIDRQVSKKLQIPGGVPGGGMVTGRIEPCITDLYGAVVGTLEILIMQLSLDPLTSGVPVKMVSFH